MGVMEEPPIYDRPCGVAGAEGWPAKIKVVQEVLEWWLVQKESGLKKQSPGFKPRLVPLQKKVVERINYQYEFEFFSASQGIGYSIPALLHSKTTPMLKNLPQVY